MQGSCLQHQAVLLACQHISRIPSHLEYGVCSVSMKWYQLFFGESLTKDNPLMGSAQVERDAQIFHLRQGHQKGNIAFMMKASSMMEKSVNNGGLSESHMRRFSFASVCCPFARLKVFASAHRAGSQCSDSGGQPSIYAGLYDCAWP